MSVERRVRVFRNGRNQAVRIPREFEFPGDEAIMRKEGKRLGRPRVAVDAAQIGELRAVGVPGAKSPISLHFQRYSASGVSGASVKLSAADTAQFPRS